MTPQRFQEVRAIFEDVIARSHAERLPTLQLLRERDPELANEVEGLIAVHQRGADLIETPVVARWRRDLVTTSAELEGCEIGPYRLLQLIGQGGMGQVWRAQQTHPVSRIVALKLIKAGMDTHEVIRRFESERQALAVMNHPAIAKVFDAGNTPSGRPYFAMELVDGLPITKYCDLRRLKIRDRLKLFVRVCEGVQHAHQKAIIHRDIKPSNVLVAEVDGKHVPKIIDFGVARAISPDSREDTALTRLGSVLGTPEYMSPEQASTLDSNIDTRSDVYSLGVLLYELLVGTVPHDFHGLSMLEVLRTISETPVQRPSSRYRARGRDSEVARNRNVAPSELEEQVRGDLDIITLQALKKNPEHRYGSPAELAADINRSLHNEPVLVRRASTVYRARKYVQRHRVIVAGLCALFLMLAAFGAWQSVELHRIRRERDRADRIAQFMMDIFQVSDPSESRGNRITAREILDRSSKGIDRGLSHDPELQAKLMGVMGRVYHGLGLYNQAEILLRHSLESRRRLTGPTSLDTAQAMHDLAATLRANGNRTEARNLDQAAFDIRNRILGSEHQDTLQSMNSLAADMEREGLYGDARRMQEAVYKADLRILGPEHRETLTAMENLGELLYSEGRLRDAEQDARQTVEIQRRTLGPDHPDRLQTVHLLAAVLIDQGRYTEAEALFRELLAARTRVLGTEHPETLKAMKALAVALEWQRRFHEAEELDRKVVASQRNIFGEEDPGLLLTESDLAHILADDGRHQEAETLARQALESSKRALGEENPRTLFLCGALAAILMGGGSLDEAERLASHTREVQIRLLGRDHAQTARTTFTLARVNALRGRSGEAIALLRDAVDHGLSPGYMLQIEREPTFSSLRKDVDFQSLITYVRRRLPAERP